VNASVDIGLGVLRGEPPRDDFQLQLCGSHGNAVGQARHHAKPRRIAAIASRVESRLVLASVAGGQRREHRGIGSFVCHEPDGLLERAQGQVRHDAHHGEVLVIQADRLLTREIGTAKLAPQSLREDREALHAMDGVARVEEPASDRPCPEKGERGGAD
jgi:hypothetical protein